MKNPRTRALFYFQCTFGYGAHRWEEQKVPFDSPWFVAVSQQFCHFHSFIFVCECFDLALGQRGFPLYHWLLVNGLHLFSSAPPISHRVIAFFCYCSVLTNFHFSLFLLSWFRGSFYPFWFSFLFFLLLFVFLTFCFLSEIQYQMEDKTVRRRKMRECEWDTMWQYTEIKENENSAKEYLKEIEKR